MESPLHFSPFLHVLLLVFFPSPQSTLQEPQAPHELHSRKKYTLLFLLLLLLLLLVVVVVVVVVVVIVVVAVAVVVVVVVVVLKSLLRFRHY